MSQRNVIIVTGCSGSGKSTALGTFEDSGFFCIDNMPLQLVQVFLEQTREDTAELAGWAFVMDMRDKYFLDGYEKLCSQLETDGYLVSIVYLEAQEQVLLRRYSQTRRNHPLGTGDSLVTAIRNEMKKITPLREKANYVIDTSNFSVHELKFAILNIARKHTSISGMAVNVVSFGFKHGTPQDADMIIDVRFLANPYFVPELKMLTGESQEVERYVLQDPETKIFLTKYLDLLSYLIPKYAEEGKAYLTIAIGCTGGMHRSVVIAKKVYEHIRQHQPTVRLFHRDVRFS